MKRPLVQCTLLIAVLGSGADAQDAQYATYHFGPRANLLGGAVLGSAVDISAVFYNPGVLARLDSIELIATSQVLELANLTFDAGPRLGLNDLRLAQAPGFFAGNLPFHFLGSNVLSYSLFTRYQFRARLGETVTGLSNQPLLTGDFAGKIRFDRDLSEEWFGLSWASRVGRFGLGISQFLAYRNQKGRDYLLAEVFPTGDEPVLGLFDYDFGFWEARLLWKMGMAFETAGMTLGITATTPSVSLLGSGDLESNTTLLGQDLDGDQTADIVFEANAQSGLAAHYHSPWAVGVGFATAPRATRLHVSAQYHGSLAEYAVLSAAPFVAQTTGDTLQLQVTTKVKGVLNFAVGGEHRFDQRLTGYVGFWTDYTSRPSDRVTDLAVSRWNILFVSVGSALRLPVADITMGFAFGWGSSKGIDAELPNGVPDGFLQGYDVRYRSLRAIISLAI
jgi:hypothetical protein